MHNKDVNYFLLYPWQVYIVPIEGTDRQMDMTLHIRDHMIVFNWSALFMTVL